MELFLVGSFWFWAICVVEAAWLLRFLHEENGWGTGLSLIGLGVVLWFFGDFNVFAWAWTNPLFMLECIGAYLVLGAVWSLSKWKMLCVDLRDTFQEVKKDFRIKNKITKDTIPPNLRSKWLDFLNDSNWGKNRWLRGRINGIEDVIPKPSEYKTAILYWLGYWPLSILWFFFHDMIERIFDWIYKTFTRVYHSIARSTFAGIPDDFGGNDENSGPKP